MILKPTRVPRFLLKPSLRTVEINWGHALAPRAGAWLFNEAGGIVYDLVAGNHGTLGADAVWSSSVLGTVVNFPGGAGSTIDLGTAGPSLQEHSITLQFMFSSLPLGSGSIIVARSSLGTDGWRYSFETTGQLGYAYNDGGVRGTYVDSGAGLSTLTPYVYTAAWRQADGAIDYYLNGAARSTIATTTGTIVNAAAGSRTATISDTFMRGPVGLLYIHDRALKASEALWIATEPYAFLRPKVARRYFVPITSSVTNTNITPSAGALTLTGTTPLVDHGRIPTTGTLTLTGVAPTATIGGNDSQTRMPNTGHLSLVRGSPRITPLAGALQWTSIAASLIVSLASLTPTAGAATLTGIAPAVVQSTVITPTTGSLALTGVAGTKDIPSPALSPDTGTLTLTGAAPTVIERGAIATPSVGTLTLTGAAPVIDIGVIPTTGTLTLTGVAPTVTSSFVGFQPPAGTLTLTGIAPSAVISTLRTPSTGTLTLTGIAGTISLGPGNTSITPNTGELFFGDGSEPGPFTGTLTLTGYAPSVVTGTLLRPAVGTLTLTGIAPTVAADSSITTVVTVGSLVLTGNQPTVLHGDAITPLTGTLTLTGQQSGVGTVVMPVTGSLTLTGQQAVTASFLRIPDTGALAFTGAAPRLDFAITPETGTLTLTGGNQPGDGGGISITGGVYVPVIRRRRR